MCRIAGIINPTLPAAATKLMVKEMCRVLQHGGPDDEGFYSNESCHLVLGHRRLSIIDLSACGHQPMSYGSGRYWISYNGELYNYPELKQALKREGWQFTTASDTEVILAAFAAWGTEGFKRLNGMFAFALFDNVTTDIFLVRDASGIKPLYYARTNEGLAFASEIRAFKSIPYLREENPYWKIYLVAYGHLPEPVTTLKQVRPLEKGCYLRYNIRSGETEQNPFKRYSFLEKTVNKNEAVQLVRDILDKAVKRHLISDAPIGVFLSGGLDSSILATLAADHTEQLKTISINFEDNSYSEKKYQDLLQQQLSGSHRQHLLKEAEFHEFLPSIINAMDLPSCDGINTWFISKYAKESGLKAVLSGIGGDELFGGYPSFNRIGTTLLLEKLPVKILRSGRFSGSKRLKRLSFLGIEGAVGRYLFLRGFFIPVDIAKHLNVDEKQVWDILSENPLLPHIDHLTPGNQASWMEINLYMQNQLVRDADVMSMAHGMEIRLPLLDAEFMKMTLQLGSAVKYGGRLQKQLLIDAFRDRLPEAIWNRKKMGFAFPFREWLSNDEYARNRAGKNKNNYHKKFIQGDLHWSQFLTLMLTENQPGE